MSEFVQQAAEFNNQRIEWLSAIQSDAVAAWQQTTLPNRKTENWKYSNIHHIETSGFYTVPAAGLSNTDIAVSIPGLEGPVIVLVDGVFSQTLSKNIDNLQSGLTLTCFSTANDDAKQKIENQINSVLALSKPDQHTFAILNTAQFSDGVFIQVKKNTVIENPIQILCINSSAEGSTATPRVLVDLETGAEATVIEHFITETDNACLTNSVTEIELNDNAILHHYRLHKEKETASHIGGVHTKLNRASRLNSFYLAMGTKLTRVDAVVNHLGEGAHCDMNGVYLPRNKQHVDFHTTIEHAVPHCTTNEVFRGIIGDNSRAVFNGRIHIHPDAQKTLAQLSNKNLLTSNKAEIDTKPELEIYADDVQCAHGATVAQLEDEAMHYLKTRGVGENDARVMLSFGFINELIDGVKLEEVADFIRPELARLLAKESLEVND